MSYSYNDILHSNENKQMTAMDNDMDEHRKQNVEKKKPDTDEQTVCDSIYVKFKNKQNSFMILWVTVVLAFRGRAGSD